MTFVLDASVALTWLLGEQPQEASRRARDALRRERAFVPTIWPLEVANVLLTQARSKRIGWADCAAGLREMAGLSVEIDAANVALACGAVAAVAQQHGLTTYDATYVELAMRRGVPLATLDQRLARAAAAAGADVF